MVTRASAQASAEQRLSELDIALPPPPTPFGIYVEAVKIGNLHFLSGMLPVVGRERVLKFYGNIARRLVAHGTFRVTTMNGLPALITEFPDAGRGQAPLLVTAVALDGEGMIERIYSILATPKLSALPSKSR